MYLAKKKILILTITLSAIMGAGAAYAWQFFYASPDAIEARYDADKYADITLIDKAHFMQRDPRWAKTPLGDTDETIGQVGCTISSVAAALTNLGINYTPAKLNAELDQSKGFTDQGWLIWSAVKKVTNAKAEVKVYSKPTHENINGCLDGKNYPIVKFMLGGVIPHWVAIVGRQDGEYLIRDPLKASPEPIALSTRTSKIQSHRCLRKAH